VQPYRVAANVRHTKCEAESGLLRTAQVVLGNWAVCVGKSLDSSYVSIWHIDCIDVGDLYLIDDHRREVAAVKVGFELNNASLEFAPDDWISWVHRLTTGLSPVDDQPIWLQLDQSLPIG
jgi:hypothetical protein